MGTTCSKNKEFSLFPGSCYLGGKGKGKKVIYPFRSFGMLSFMQMEKFRLDGKKDQKASGRGRGRCIGLYIHK